ncbi:hypothetical protein ABZX66_16985 [Micromonospora aurantiaca]|uniref:hypothetical protein n=1 Tax=Micromonospora aurantiaca (nom. illeg.) TaxID=47850 RepID=UPI0033AA5ACA
MSTVSAPLPPATKSQTPMGGSLTALPGAIHELSAARTAVMSFVDGNYQLVDGNIPPFKRHCRRRRRMSQRERASLKHGDCWSSAV